MDDNLAVAQAFKKAANLMEKEFMACHFLWQLNGMRHGQLLVFLENQFTLGNNVYPKNLTDAYNLFVKWKCKRVQQQPGLEYCKPNEGVTLLATDIKPEKKKPQMSQPLNVLIAELWVTMPVIAQQRSQQSRCTLSPLLCHHLISLQCPSHLEQIQMLVQAQPLVQMLGGTIRQVQLLTVI